MFAKKVLENGGIVKPLLIPHEFLNGPSLCNPSILNNGGELIVNLRNINYVLYHSELGVFEHSWGPLCYLHGENDQRLFTKNILCELDESLNIKKFDTIDTFLFDQKPLWEFVGLEDGRLINWNNEIYLSGVRRDTTTNGQGRMELSELQIDSDRVLEVSRHRIPAPGADDSYCEKNWMPIIDMPYHYLKWCNPVDVVKYDPVNKTCDRVVLGNQYFFDRDQRGGGQVIPWENGYLSLIHETNLYNSEAGRKDGTYRHKFIHWSKDWKPIKTSPVFSFMGAKIEFACGLALYKDDVLVTFGFQDNVAYIARCSQKVLKEYIYA